MYGCSTGTVRRWMRRYRENNDYSRLPGSGRKRIVSDEVIREIILKVKRNRLVSCREIQEELGLRSILNGLSTIGNVSYGRMNAYFHFINMENLGTGKNGEKFFQGIITFQLLLNTSQFIFGVASIVMGREIYSLLKEK
jgi:hypothetical protein